MTSFILGLILVVERIVVPIFVDAPAGIEPPNKLAVPKSSLLYPADRLAYTYRESTSPH